MKDELSPRQAAERIGATTRSVQRWIASGRLPARRVGGRWRVAIDAIDAFMAADGLVDGPVDRPAHAPDRPIRRLFIANRGEIATRIARTCDRLGIVAIVPVTDGPGALDLLDIDAVVGAASRAAADAIHPGFGFLAENAAFAEAVAEAGLIWVGPPSAAIRAMGDKAAARRLALSLDVPVIPGYDGPDQSDAELAAEAARIDWPLLIKPVAGGGGKGMHTVRVAERFTDALAAARREARAAFGDERLILERLIEGPRHVEIQVLFDAHGAGVSLGERDCSLQRRHQKILEETPSPGVDRETRSHLENHALRLAAAVGYVGAGTCEFLVDDRGSAWFLEMNTRLQVEHPVTELVTGRDLVADQLAIAAGRRLAELDPPLADRASVPSRGHAVEVRLYAEEAEAGFLPATGRIEALRWPEGPGIRVDTGVARGSEITSRFDPMLAKIIAHGSDRSEALDRLATALDETLVLGLTTNLRFLRWVVREQVVITGQARIDTLERIWPPDDWADRTVIPANAWQAAAAHLAPAAGGADDPWAGGWRVTGPARLSLDAEGQTRVVTLETPPDGSDVVIAGDIALVDVGGRSVAFRPSPPPDVDRAARAASAHAHGSGADVVAPMPGVVIAVHVTVGDTVEPGQAIATMEAMKMEHTVVAPVAGTVADVSAPVGTQMARGELLATINA